MMREYQFSVQSSAADSHFDVQYPSVDVLSKLESLFYWTGKFEILTPPLPHTRSTLKLLMKSYIWF